MGSVIDSLMRKIGIIEFIYKCKHTTRERLSQEFDVNIRTVDRDLEILTQYYPISSKTGINGGIYIDENFKLYRLSKEQAGSLIRAINILDEPDKRNLKTILVTFAPEYLIIDIS